MARHITGSGINWHDAGRRGDEGKPLGIPHYCTTTFRVRVLCLGSNVDCARLGSPGIPLGNLTERRPAYIKSGRSCGTRSTDRLQIDAAYSYVVNTNMLVVELTCRLVRILLSLLLIAASGASTATGETSRHVGRRPLPTALPDLYYLALYYFSFPGIRLIPEKRFILAPLKINNTVELQCQVPGDATPQWKFDGEHTVYAGHNEDIVITDSNNTSVIRIEDSGLRRFRSSASADLSIDCIAYGFRYSHSERRFIVLFREFLQVAQQIINSVITIHLQRPLENQRE